ncbi:MAG: hypothetical protein MUF56_07625 [Solirubrobacteraceae bacterium]|nr:hypothetical protein [Solirubrobacteraceae bacterium]
MKWLMALAALVAAASITVAVVVVVRERDPVPDEIRACLDDAGLSLARSSEALGVAWGRTAGVLLQAPERDYAVLALWNADTPSLARGDVGRRVYSAPSKFPAVAIQVPRSDRLVACAERHG